MIGLKLRAAFLVLLAAYLCVNFGYRFWQAIWTITRYGALEDGWVIPMSWIGECLQTLMIGMIVFALLSIDARLSRKN